MFHNPINNNYHQRWRKKYVSVSITNWLGL